MNISVLTCLWIISSVYFPFSILNGFISSQTYFLLISPASLRRWDSRPKLCRYDKWIVFPCRYSQVAQRWEHLQQTPCSGWSEMLSVPLDGWYRPEGQQQSIWSHRVCVNKKKTWQSCRTGDQTSIMFPLHSGSPCWQVKGEFADGSSYNRGKVIDILLAGEQYSCRNDDMKSSLYFQRV